MKTMKKLSTKEHVKEHVKIVMNIYKEYIQFIGGKNNLNMTTWYNWKSYMLNHPNYPQ